jgi:hypothetical protein
VNSQSTSTTHRLDFHEASEDEVLKFEQGINDFVAQIPLPGDNFTSSAYQILTYVEDRPRCLLVSSDFKVTDKPDDPLIIMIASLLGRNVFALRHLLARLWSGKRHTSKIPKRMSVDGAAYRQMAEALDAFNDYQYFSHALKGFRMSYWNCRIDSKQRVLEFAPKPGNDGYDALNFCLAGPQMSETTILQHWLAWVIFPEECPEIVSKIVDSARVLQDGRIVYQFKEDLANALRLHLPGVEMGVPENWAFPWGPSAAVSRLVNALHLRCIYHLCAIHFTAVQNHIEGGGVDDLCLIATRGSLVQDLHKLTQMPVTSIVAFVSAITYGQGTKSPDPALQPLIPLGNSAIAVPSMLVCSLRSGRNLLTLHARLNPRTFDAQSADFEREMLGSLKLVFSAKFSNVKINAQLPKSLGGEELDLVVFDTISRTIFIGEARATVMPADPSEIFRRLTGLEHKVQQVQRKMASVQAHLDGILAWTGLRERVDGWQILGCVILRGHAGALSGFPNIPVVAEYIISVGVPAISSAMRLHQWLVSQAWLPQRGIHFNTVATSHRFGEYEVKFGGVRDLKPLDYLRNHLPGSIQEYSA